MAATTAEQESWVLRVTAVESTINIVTLAAKIQWLGMTLCLKKIKKLSLLLRGKKIVA
jgi:hypothetical protein